MSNEPLLTQVPQPDEPIHHGAPPALRWAANLGILVGALLLLYLLAESIYGKHPIRALFGLIADFGLLIALIGLRLMQRWAAYLYVALIMVAVPILVILGLRGVFSVGVLMALTIVPLVLLVIVLGCWRELR